MSGLFGRRPTGAFKTTPGAFTPATISAGDQPNEYIATNLTTDSTSGASVWGMHQCRLVRMSDETLFAFGGSAATLDVYRSATGGTYGAPWTLVASIPRNGPRDEAAHLLRNPVLDVVHLIWCNAIEYRVRTWTSAGVEIDESALPGMFDATAYSAASIGPDGTMVLSLNTSGLFNGITYGNMNSGKRFIKARWNGLSMEVSSAIQTAPFGDRIAYDRMWVDPIGDGYVYGLALTDVKYYEFTSANNPNYTAGWANTIASNSIGFSYYFPQLVLYKLRLDDLSGFSRKTILAVQFRTSDISSSTINYAETGNISATGDAIDSLGNVVMQSNVRGIDASDTKVFVRVSLPSGRVQYTPNFSSSGGSGVIASVSDGSFYTLFGDTQSGNPVLKSAAFSLGAQDFMMPFTINTATNVVSSAACTNQATGLWEAFDIRSLHAGVRSGSLQMTTYVDYLNIITGYYSGGVGTMVAYGSTAYQMKRVRFNVAAESTTPFARASAF